MRAYTALAEEKFEMRVYPILINILPPPKGVVAETRYESEVMGLRAMQEYRVINLFEMEASVVFETPLPSLLPFVPIMRGGGEESIIRKAVYLLRDDETLSEMQPLLAYFAAFVPDTELVRQIMRWDMIVLERNPWYMEALTRGKKEGLEEGKKEGKKEGKQEGLRDAIVAVLEAGFGPLSVDATAMVRQEYSLERLDALNRTAAVVGSILEFLEELRRPIRTS